jgi:predicted RNA-binding Zn ribbon-like protein
MEAEFEFTGGALCLDFANTVNHRGQPQREEDSLGSYRDLLRWSQEAGTLGKVEAQRLERRAQRKPAMARNVLSRARTLREAIYQLFARPARTTPETELGAINREISQLASKVGLGSGAGRYAWLWQGAADDLARVLWPILRNVVELMTMPGRHVSVCEAKNCNWLFLDTSKNHSRRWCDMKVCGNRVKARRYYRRHARRRQGSGD